ncbi:putative metal-binding motif-containing protein [Candidatus Woesearchaeota archaeon]|nr:putative metal-binding motif-containing protein [Candidatus Woesearchaeota archaeon]
MQRYRTDMVILLMALFSVLFLAIAMMESVLLPDNMTMNTTNVLLALLALLLLMIARQRAGMSNASTMREGIARTLRALADRLDRQTFKYAAHVKRDMKKEEWIELGIFLGICASIFFLSSDPTLTGFMILDISDEYIANATLTGVVDIPFGSQDFVPNETIIKVKLGTMTKKVPVSEVAQGLSFGTGKYYYRGALGGSGYGYGLVGNKTIYPNITVTLNVTTHVVSGNITNTTSKLVNRTINKDFSDPYAVPEENMTVFIVPSTTRFNRTALPDDTAAFTVINGIVYTTTPYSYSEQGFGEGYTTTKRVTAKLDLQTLQLHAENARLTVALEHNGDTLDTLSERLVVEQDKDGDGHAAGTDCNDNDATIYPGAKEIPNDKKDNDCDAATLDVTDGDGDSFPLAVDCDDTNPLINPAVMEQCNGKDDNCNGQTDEQCPAACVDNDEDSYGAGDTRLCTHAKVDCDDTNARINPGAPETKGDGKDNDCNPDTMDKLPEREYSLFELSPRTALANEPLNLSLGITMPEEFNSALLQSVILTVQQEGAKPDVYTQEHMVLGRKRLFLSGAFNSTGRYALNWTVVYGGTRREVTSAVVVEQAPPVTGAAVVLTGLWKWGTGVLLIALLSVTALFSVRIVRSALAERRPKQQKTALKPREQKTDYVTLDELQESLKEKPWWKFW